MESRKRREARQLWLIALLCCHVCCYGKAVPEDSDKYITGYEYSFKNDKYEVRPLYGSKKALEYSERRNLDANPIQYEYDGKTIFVPPLQRPSEFKEMLNDYYNPKAKLNPLYQDLQQTLSTHFQDYSPVWTPTSKDIYNPEEYDSRNSQTTTSSLKKNLPNGKNEAKPVCKNCHVATQKSSTSTEPDYYTHEVDKKEHDGKKSHLEDDEYYKPVTQNVKKITTGGKRNKKTKVKHSSHENDKVFSPIIKNRIKQKETIGTATTGYSKFQTENNIHISSSKTNNYNTNMPTLKKDETTKMEDKLQKEKIKYTKINPKTGAPLKDCLDDDYYKNIKSPEMHDYPIILERKKHSSKPSVEYEDRSKVKLSSDTEDDSHEREEFSKIDSNLKDSYKYTEKKIEAKCKTVHPKTGAHVENCKQNLPESQTEDEIEYPAVVKIKKHQIKSSKYDDQEMDSHKGKLSSDLENVLEVEPENFKESKIALEEPLTKKSPEKKVQKKMCKTNTDTGVPFEECFSESEDFYQTMKSLEMYNDPIMVKRLKHSLKPSVQYDEYEIKDGEKHEFSSDIEDDSNEDFLESNSNLKDPLTKKSPEKKIKEKCTKIHPKTGDKLKDCPDDENIHKSTIAPKIKEKPAKVETKEVSTKTSVKHNEYEVYDESDKFSSDVDGTLDEHVEVVEDGDLKDAIKELPNDEDELDIEDSSSEPNVPRNINIEHEVENSGNGLDLDKPDILVDDRLRSLSLLNSNLFSLVFNPNAKDRNLKKCVTRNNETGFCMYIQNCPVPNLTISLEQLLNNACAVDEVFIGVCCPEFPVETIEVQWERSEMDSSDKEVDDDFEPENEDCGTRSNEASKMQSWPWKAPLVTMSNGKIFCGGVIIGEEYVLTAAHCTTKIPKNQILVRLGQHDDSSGEDFAVIEIKRHAQYNPRTMQNDIALLKLGRRMPFGKHINKICLPEDDGESHAGEKALLLGWKGVFGENPKKSEFLEVMSNEECRKRMNTNVHHSLLCTEARNEDERTCNADSGAPLVIEDDDNYEIIGILSWNRNDCDQKFPSTFSRVSNYIGWIQKHAV